MKPAVYFIYAFLFSMIVFGIYQAYLYATDSPYRISSADAKQRIKGHKIDVILDVRTDTERNTLGFYPGSVHIQSADLERMMPKLVPNKQTRILAYCNTGHRARMATDKLHALGYDNAVYISSTYTTLL
jgi:rhodanese-related sulfurtransferase